MQAPATNCFLLPVFIARIRHHNAASTTLQMPNAADTNQDQITKNVTSRTIPARTDSSPVRTNPIPLVIGRAAATITLSMLDAATGRPFLHGLRPTPMTMTTPRRTSGGRRAEFSASSSLAVACENAEDVS